MMTSKMMTMTKLLTMTTLTMMTTAMHAWESREGACSGLCHSSVCAGMSCEKPSTHS